MRYYAPRPIYGYLLSSLPGASLFAGTIIHWNSIQDTEVTDDEWMQLFLTVFCLAALFFVIRGFYKRHRRDYVQLMNRFIEWVTYTEKTMAVRQMHTKDIRLLEVAYPEGSRIPSFYRFYGATEKETGSLERYNIPHKDVVQYCKKNRIPILDTVIRRTHIHNVKVTVKAIKIDLTATALIPWKRTRTISFIHISGIDFVSTHPVSRTEDCYMVTTTSGKVYTFSPRVVDEKRLARAARIHGMQIYRQYNERASK